jgi:AcrR family transcriptional regulator
MDRTSTTTKRERTRERLLLAALELFERDGYDATSAADIAAAADVSEMTFFRHFATKAQLLLDDPYDPLIAAAVAAQPRDLPPVVRVARGLRAGFAAVPDTDTDLVRRRLRIAARTPSLLAPVRSSTARSEDVVAAQLVADGTPERDARVAAVAVLSGVTEGLLRWSLDGGGSLGEALLAALDVVEAVR